MKPIRHFLMMEQCSMKYTETNSEKKTTKTKSKKNAVIPGYHLSLGIVITMLSVIVLIPLASVLVYSLRISPVEFLGLILKENVSLVLSWHGVWSNMNFRGNGFWMH